MFSCKSGEHTQCAPYTYLRRSIRKEGRRGRSGERPLNGVTPRQSHHLSIVWAKPSKSTANRFCLPSLLRHPPPRALLLSRVQLILCPLCSRANTVHAGQPPPLRLPKEEHCLRSSPTSNSLSLPRIFRQGTEIETFLSLEYLVTGSPHRLLETWTSGTVAS